MRENTAGQGRAARPPQGRERRQVSSSLRSHPKAQGLNCPPHLCLHSQSAGSVPGVLAERAGVLVDCPTPALAVCALGSRGLEPRTVRQQHWLPPSPSCSLPLQALAPTPPSNAPTWPPASLPLLTWGLSGAGLQVTRLSAHGLHQRVTATHDVGALVALHISHSHAHPTGLGALMGDREGAGEPQPAGQAPPPWPGRTTRWS